MKQIFEITRAPEEPPLSSDEIRNVLFRLRKHSEWDVREQIPLTATMPKLEPNAGMLRRSSGSAKMRSLGDLRYASEENR